MRSAVFKRPLAEAGNLFQHRVIDARGVDLHSHLPQIRLAGNSCDGRAGECLGKRVHELG